ncbi:hypothetical protein GGQ74_001785 [Desulfobaculum xiamenense]|uniref:Pathogenicity locus n=1 Tax=Desulfobaculum xiamenense TaxID=995050 RepID=A0A846QNS2_9BACT|nr:helix-hairpin-helix domain-containing protein [Desulfobaculum xiamenense]NJB68112.1 hypothetical protein [Desulfobaculum xiamenense]
MTATLKDLQRIPGVGPSLARDLADLGYRGVDELSGHDPQRMYERLMELRGQHIDRCVLYVFRLAVYFAEGGREPDRLKWWNWKDSKTS